MNVEAASDFAGFGAIGQCSDQIDAWLSAEAGKEILVPYPADQMTVWAISPRVNSPQNEDPGILDPILGDVQARRPDIG